MIQILIDFDNLNMLFGNKKIEAETLHKLEIWWLEKNGFLLSGFHLNAVRFSRYGSSEDIAFTSYIFDDEKYLEVKDVWGAYKIFITETPCHFGGTRKWFLCPLIRMGTVCSRRVGVLYGIEKRFGCRQCLNLTYRSRNVSRNYRGKNVYYFIDNIARLQDAIERPMYNGKQTKRYKKLLTMVRLSKALKVPYNKQC